MGGGINNVVLEKADCYALNDSYCNKFDGVTCIQTLSWLPGYKKPLEQICKLNSRWVACSALFYEGKINYTISLENYERPQKDSPFSQVYYNVYSVPLIKKFFEERGYTNFVYSPYEIDIDIDRPEHLDLGYYTVKTLEGHRLAFNTCLFQPEGFIFASK